MKSYDNYFIDLGGHDLIYLEVYRSFEDNKELYSFAINRGIPFGQFKASLHGFEGSLLTVTDYENNRFEYNATDKKFVNWNFDKAKEMLSFEPLYNYISFYHTIKDNINYIIESINTKSEKPYDEYYLTLKWDNVFIYDEMNKMYIKGKLLDIPDDYYLRVRTNTWNELPDHLDPFYTYDRIKKLLEDKFEELDEKIRDMNDNMNDFYTINRDKAIDLEKEISNLEVLIYENESRITDLENELEDDD